MRLSPSARQLLRIPPDRPKTPIFAVLSAQPKSLAAYCQTNGLIVRGIVPPTVPSGKERIRICLHAGNTFEQVDKLVSVIREWVLQQSANEEPNTRPRL